jgi:hypothetical protein
MGSVVRLAFVLALGSAAPANPLPSRPWTGPLAVVPHSRFANFDLEDVRTEMLAIPPVEDEVSHSVFRLRRHVGAAMGYDQGVLHGSVGFYVTVAELGRWYLGVSSPAIGLSRHRVFDRRRQEPTTKTETTILVSLASVHLRGGYLPSIRKVWYLNLEQIFDPRSNINGLQVGLSFSSP